MGFRQWSRRSHFLIGLFFVVLGSLMLTVVVFTKPWVKRPQIVSERMKLPIPSIERGEEPTTPRAVETKEMEEEPSEVGTLEGEKLIVSKLSEPSGVIQARGRDEKGVIIGGIEEDEKTPAEERPHKDTVFRREIFEGDAKIRKKIPTAIPAQEKRAASEIHEKSVKKIPQSRPIAPEMVELERERGAAEPPRTRTPKQQDERGGFRFEEKMAERNREEKVDEKIAKKDMKVKGKASSPVETSSPLVKSETAITAKKSSIEGEERVVQPKQPSLIATEEEIRQFFADYVERYNQKDINGFLSLFSPKAIQNQRDGFDEIRRIYFDFFNKSRKLRYHLGDMKIKINQNAAEARGHYKLVQKRKRSWKKKVWKGDIRWVLVRENGALKIRYLDYTPEKSS